MSVYIAFTGVTSLLFFLTGLFVYTHDPRHPLYFRCFVFSASVSLWALGYFFTLFSIPNYTFNMCASRFSHAFGAFIPVTYLHFVWEILKRKKKKNFFLAAYTISGLMFLACLTPLVVRVLLPKMGIRYYPEWGILYPVYSSLYLVFPGFAQFEMGKEILRTRGNERIRLIYFFIALGLAFAGGISLFLLVFNWSFPPFLSVLIILYPPMMAYTILVHKFMDIEVIIRKTVIFAGLLMFVFGVFSTAAILVREVLAHFGANHFWTYCISLFFIVLGYDPIRNMLVNVTDKYFFQKKYDYRKLLQDASRGMSKIESLNHLLSLVVHFVTMKMRVKNSGVLMRRRDHEFELCFQRGFEKQFLDYRLDDTNPMLMYLKQEKEAIDIERIEEYRQEGNRKKVKGEAPHEYDFQAIALTLRDLQAACVVPSFLGKELRSVLLLGEKKSGDYYTTEDLTVLFTLAQESAIAIENAKLYDEAIAKSHQLEKINEQLEYSKGLLIKALHETEIANKQLQDTQVQLIHEQKMATLGRLAASVGHEVNNPLTILSMNVSRAILKYRKNPDLKVGEVLDLFQKMEQNIGRIKAVVNTLTGLLKRSEKGKFEPLSLKLILEETLPLVQFQTYLDNLTGTEVEFDIPGSIPLVRGDLERLQEVFLNLFINAYHAMTGRRNRKIRVTAEPEPENTSNILIHFTDNGSGMTEEIMKKIFNYGFTTKPPGRGSGMGLYMCKYIIELHGGDIRVRSKLGEGTTFTIVLPSYEEAAGEGTYRLEASS